MRPLRLGLAAFFALTVVTRTAGAWDAVGHKTIARIAWDHMTDQARRAVTALLMAGPPDAQLEALRPTQGEDADRDRQLFVVTSTWADLVRAPGQRHTYNHANWHYADFFWANENGRVVDLPPIGPEVPNAVERLGAFEQSLRRNVDADSTRAIEIAWVLHLVGDLHQPLHCSSRVTADSPRGDHGGNDVKLGDAMNLHAYWDVILGAAVPRRDGEGDDAFVERMAHDLQERYPASLLGDAVNSRDYTSWQRDGLALAKAAYDGVQPGEAPADAYRASTLETSERAMTLAGYRLAALLNSIYK